MADGGPNWEGLLKWSLAHSDGTRPNRNLSEEDRKWFMEAVQSQTIDVVKRMKEITLVMQTPEQVLEAQGVTPADIEDLLDELQEHVESIDMANDLHSIGGLVPLLGHLKNPHANIRAKAAEVVTTIVQRTTPRASNWLWKRMAWNICLLISHLTLMSQFEPKLSAQFPVLLANIYFSALIRHNKPGITAFRLANGYAALRDALASENVRFQRKALNLIQFLLHENSSDCNVVTELGFPRIMLHLASSEDLEVREAALRGLLALAQDKTDGANSRLAEEDEKLKQLLQGRIKSISSMHPEDLGAAREERQLVDSLWNACYNEPSSLREKGLLVLPGEDAPPPDVASKLFEPRLRAFSVNPTDTKPATEKKEAPPLLLGLGPPSDAANTHGNSGARDDTNGSSQTN